ncbi:MAG: amidophosphoribosyltransferase [archaeon]
MEEKCGVCGVSGRKSAELILYRMLVQMQHRGQLSAGITSYKPKDAHILYTYKDIGLVNSVFKAENAAKFANIMEKLSTDTGIGHVRYATSGGDDPTYAQPFEHLHGKKNRWFSLCFNGNIANYEETRKNLEKQNYHFIRKTDTELMLLLLAKELKGSKSLAESFNNLSTHLDGAYSIGFLNAEGTIAAARDPLGFKPLCYSHDDGEIAFASESVALENNGFGNVKDIKPGQMIIKERDSFSIETFAKSERCAHCFFEWVYFAHPASKIEGKLVYEARYNLGKELAREETQKIDKDCVVVSVPDSSTPAGYGFAEQLGLPIREGLIRNRYVGRTFIQSRDRAQRVKEKFMLIKDVFKDKKVFLIEDSIVRGTTLKNLISYIKENGQPKEIHVRVSCPPIMHPCFYGIDMSTRKELIAARKKIDEIAKEIGADSLRYQSTEGMIKSIGLPQKDLCMACLNGEYPTEAGNKCSEKDGQCKLH